MRILTPTISALLLLAASGTSTAAIFKCTAADGSVSYQDQPCPADESQHSRADQQEPASSGSRRESITIDGETVRLVYFPVPGLGEVQVPVFEHMEYTTRSHDDRAATIALRAKPGQDPMQLQMTFFANRPGRSYSAAEAMQFLADIDPQLTNEQAYADEFWSFETQLGNIDFETSIRENPRSFGSEGRDPQSGEFTTATTGLKRHPNVVVAVTILTNGRMSEGLRGALRVVNAFFVLATELPPEES